MNKEELEAVTETLQAQERLHLVLKGRGSADQVFQKSVSIIDTLREMKSEIEGTQIQLKPVKVDEEALGPLKQLALMHVPGSLTVDVKAQFKDMVTNMFQGSCKKVIFGALITCPWYMATQTDRGLQAKHNNILVVYTNHDDQFFTPANPHIKEEQCEIIEHDWFYAAEVYHFAHYLLKGKSRFIEGFCLPDSAVFIAEDEWLSLKQSLSPELPCNLRGFLEQCRGQAVGAVAKKSKSGKMKLKEGAFLRDFCDSCRLLYHASNILDGKDVCLENILEADTFKSNQHTQEAFSTLESIYQSEGTGKNKYHMLDMVMKWRKSVDPLMNKHKFVKPDRVEKILGEWQHSIRLGDKQIQHSSISEEASRTVQPLIDRIGDNISKMKPEKILLVAQAGSYLYGLNTPESDVDFIVIYADPVENVVSACSRPVESFESRGPSKLFEFGAYEARLLCEMLWKGSVVILELVFSDSLEYVSDAWKILHENRKLFVTERAILQYFGLIKNNMVMIENKKHKDTPREKKLFYQIFHKLSCIEQMISGEVPTVKCTEEIRDFIMKVRKGPLEGELHRDKLYDLIKQKYGAAKSTLTQRKHRLPENVSYTFLLDWLKRVRGLN